MENTTNSFFCSLQNLQQYLRLHKTNFKNFFNQISVDSSYLSLDYYTLSDFLNNFILLKENMTILLLKSSQECPFYLKIEGLQQEFTSLKEIIDEMQYKKDDSKSFIKSMKKHIMSGGFDKVDIFLNTIFKHDFNECLNGINEIREEIIQILTESKELKKNKKINEMYIKKIHDKIKCYNMMLDFWVNERLEMLEDPTLLQNCQNFIKEFLTLYQKFESQSIKMSTLKKDLKNFFNCNSLKKNNMSVKEIPLDLISNLINYDDPAISCQNVEIMELDSFSRIKFQPIKEINMAESQKFMKILSKKQSNDDFTSPYLKEVMKKNEEIINMIVFSCNRIFEDLSTVFHLKFNALNIIKKGMDLSIPFFIKKIDNSLIKNLALVVYLGFVKELIFDVNEENIFQEFIQFGVECFFVWGKLYNKIKLYSNFSLAFNILMEKNVEFPTTLKYFEGKQAISLEQQVLHKIMREKNLMKELLENTVQELQLSEFHEKLRNLDNLLENSDLYDNSETITSFIKEKEFSKSIKKEFEDFTKNRLNYLDFRNNVLKILIKNKYENESIALSSKLPHKLPPTNPNNKKKFLVSASSSTIFLENIKGIDDKTHKDKIFPSANKNSPFNAEQIIKPIKAPSFQEMMMKDINNNRNRTPAQKLTKQGKIPSFQEIIQDLENENNKIPSKLSSNSKIQSCQNIADNEDLKTTISKVTSINNINQYNIQAEEKTNHNLFMKQNSSENNKANAYQMSENERILKEKAVLVKKMQEFSHKK